MAAVAESLRRHPARRRPGWLVVATKEFGDHVTSIRFVVLLLILALAVAAPLYFASQTLRTAAGQASGVRAIFLWIFANGAPASSDLTIPPFFAFVGLLGPLLGIAFGFDAVNVERTQGTLPRLISQPIHRDDVINGKFAAALATIALMVAALSMLVVGVAIVRLGIAPGVIEVLRLVAWYLVAVVYIGFWLALAVLLSVAIRQAAASALVGIGLWFFLTILWQIPAGIIAQFLTPAASSPETAVAAQRLPGEILRLSPATMYQEASLVLLNPILTPQFRFDLFGVASPAQYTQLASQQAVTFFSVDQSILLVLPQIVVLVALTVAFFAASYILFMRQEVRA